MLSRYSYVLVISWKHVFLALPVLLWPFLALPIFLLVHFGADLFGANFTKIIFFSFWFQFLIYKKNFSLFFHFFLFQKQSKDFLFICNKFLSTLQKKYKFKHTATVFLFGYLFDVEPFLELIFLAYFRIVFIVAYFILVKASFSHSYFSVKGITVLINCRFFWILLDSNVHFIFFLIDCNISRVIQGLRDKHFSFLVAIRSGAN